MAARQQDLSFTSPESFVHVLANQGLDNAPETNESHFSAPPSVANNKACKSINFSYDEDARLNE